MKFYLTPLFFLIILSDPIQSIMNKGKTREDIQHLYYFATAAALSIQHLKYHHPDNLSQDVRQCFSPIWSGTLQIVDENDSKYFLNEGAIIFRTLLKRKIHFKYLYKSYSYTIEEILPKIKANKDYLIRKFGGRTKSFVSLYEQMRERRLFAEPAKKGKKAPEMSELTQLIIRETVKRFRQLFVKTKHYLTKLFSGIPAVRKMLDSFDCIAKKHKKINATALINIQVFIDKVKTLLLKGWPGFIEIWIDTLYNWNMFKKAVNGLITAFYNKNTNTLWIESGTFLGNLASAMTGVFKK